MGINVPFNSHKIYFLFILTEFMHQVHVIYSLNFIFFCSYITGCSFILTKFKFISGACSVTQSCPALCDRMDCSPPGSSVHGILQARILEWAAISSSRIHQIHVFYSLSFIFYSHIIDFKLF